jgi:hypothetical protein
MTSNIAARKFPMQGKEIGNNEIGNVGYVY